MITFSGRDHLEVTVLTYFLKGFTAFRKIVKRVHDTENLGTTDLEHIQELSAQCKWQPYSQWRSSHLDILDLSRGGRITGGGKRWPKTIGYVVETILPSKNIRSKEFFAVSLSLFSKFKLFFFVIMLNASTQNTKLLYFSQVCTRRKFQSSPRLLW